MATQQKGGFCPTCNQSRLGTKQVLGDGLGCILTILTGGLFLLLWLPLKFLSEYPAPYRCTVCGTPIK